MTLHAAFLRGINLGSRRLTMDELRSVVEAFGLDDVATYAASGNVFFRHPDPEAGLEAALEAHFLEAFEYPVATFIRPVRRLEALVNHDELTAAEEDGFSPHVIFLRDEATAEMAKELRALEGPDDRFLILAREVAWLRRGGISDAPISNADLERALGSDQTMRKLTALRRMAAKFGGSS